MKQWFARDLCGSVPHRHVDGADRDRAFAMAAGLFIAHHRGPNPVRIEVCPGIIQQAFRLCFKNPVGEALADQAALTVAAVRVEAVADDTPAVAHRIGDNGNKARRHLGEIDIGIADWRRDRLRDFTNFEDTNRHKTSCVTVFSGAAVWVRPPDFRSSAVAYHDLRPSDGWPASNHHEKIHVLLSNGNPQTIHSTFC